MDPPAQPRSGAHDLGGLEARSRLPPGGTASVGTPPADPARIG